MQENVKCEEITVVVIAEGDGVWLKKTNQSHEQPVMCMKNSVLENLNVATSVM